MNYLQLVQRSILECGASGATNVTTVVGQTGEALRFVNWVNDAWTDIQMDCSQLDFMRASNILGSGVSFETVAGQASYPLGTGAGTVGLDPELFGNWVDNAPDGSGSSFWNQTTTVGFANEIQMPAISFGNWRNVYAQGANRNVRTRPVVFAVGPDKSICLGPYPNATYTVTGDYYVAPREMTVDADVPTGLPTRFMNMIWYRVLMKYGMYEAAPEAYQRGKEENAGMYAQLQALYAPKIGFGGALA